MRSSERVGATGKLEGTRGVASGITTAMRTNRLETALWRQRRRQRQSTRRDCRLSLSPDDCQRTADAVRPRSRSAQRVASLRRSSLDSYAFVTRGVSSTALTSLLDASPLRSPHDPRRVPRHRCLPPRSDPRSRRPRRSSASSPAPTGICRAGSRSPTTSRRSTRRARASRRAYARQDDARPAVPRRRSSPTPRRSRTSSTTGRSSAS